MTVPESTQDPVGFLRILALMLKTVGGDIDIFLIEPKACCYILPFASYTTCYSVQFDIVKTCSERKSEQIFVSIALKVLDQTTLEKKSLFKL